jgi:hypothetical protein
MKYYYRLFSKIEKYKLRRFVATFNKQTFEKRNLKKKNQKVMLINQGMHEYGYFNFTFLNNMLSLIVTVLSRGYIPVVQLDNRKEGWTNWETFFEQPFHVQDYDQLEICNLRQGLIAPSFATPFRTMDLNLWRKIYTDFAVLNTSTQKYVDDEYQSLIAGKKVLGVLCRGTDYVQKKPYGHPIQPRTEEVITLVKQKMIELDLEYIYLATEEYRIVKQFEEVFPSIVIVNKRTYYDDIFLRDHCTEIYQVHFDRENDIYLKGLEYLSSIWLLSRCHALVAGNCGGSTSALYLNNGKYIYWHLFDLGLYGINK